MELNLKNKKTSEYAVSQLFANWVKKDFGKINKYIQKTWLNNEGKDGFKKMFGMIEATDYYIYDKEIITDCREEVDFRLDIIFRGKEVSMYGKANTICEIDSYQPSPKGQWGVNPISILRWVKQK